MRNMPPKPCWATRPCPPHWGQTTGLVPGLAPVPLHFSQVSCFSNSIVFSAPVATSASVSSTCVSRSNPRDAPARPPPPPPPPCRGSAERPAEDVVEHREDVADVHVREVVLPLDAGVAELVVAPALLVVGQDLVRLGALLERAPRPRPSVAVVAVGVILHRQLAIGALDLVAVGGLGDAEDFVIISFRGGH